MVLVTRLVTMLIKHVGEDWNKDLGEGDGEDSMI